MNREIKFRGIDERTNKWVYGYYWQNGFNNHFIKQIVDDSGKYGTEDYEVIPETVGQATGLKDKNGKEIYEGDKVRIIDGECYQGVWEYDNQYTVKDIRNIEFLFHGCVEITGNIFDKGGQVV